MVSQLSALITISCLYHVYAVISIQGWLGMVVGGGGRGGRLGSVCVCGGGGGGGGREIVTI